jgi:hypothetical protein
MGIDTNALFEEFCKMSDEEQLASMSQNKVIREYPDDSEVASFLKIHFARFPFLIINAEREVHGRLKEELERYAKYIQADIEYLNGATLTVNDVKGEPEFNDDNNTFTRRRPEYFPDDKIKMIIVENITQNTNVELLRAFLYVGIRPDSFSGSTSGGYTIPDGSGFVFISEIDSFPDKEFASLSSYWSRRFFTFVIDESNN